MKKNGINVIDSVDIRIQGLEREANTVVLVSIDHVLSGIVGIADTVKVTMAIHGS